MTAGPRWASAMHRAKMHRATTHLSQDLFGGPRPWSLAAVIDFRKGGTFAFLGMLMWWYGNQSVAAWTYVAMHWSYGLVSLLISGIAKPHYPLADPVWLALCVSLCILGCVILTAADAQKFYTLRVRPGLITDGMHRYIRHPNYLGEMLVYGSFAMVVWHWIPVVVLGWVWLGVFAVNMMMKEASLSRYPEWAAYRTRTRWLVPGLFTVLLSFAAPLAAPVAGLAAQTSAPQAAARQTEADAYTRYELLAPGSAKFRILYEVTATTPGATHYFNPIRTGSIATDESVFDRATGKPLPFSEVGAEVARAGGVRVADSTQRYIRVTLARPVPANDGEGRVLILKTYEDRASYFTRGDTVVFTRSLGIKRNSVVLPAGYELLSSSYPAQVLQEADGRIGISFWNTTPAEAPVTLRALPRRGDGGVGTRGGPAGGAQPANPSSVGARLGERAHEDREIVYFLQQPETHAFDLYHDYTESRPGTSTYLNVVRVGSTVSNPGARDLDTGEEMRWEVLKGDAITRAGLDVPDVKPATEVVVFRFAPVQRGASIRLRMSETYTDSVRYRLIGDELVWDRAFGRPANAVVLPAGWMLTNSSIPATVSTRPDGRVQLDFINPRPDEIAVLITARRR